MSLTLAFSTTPWLARPQSPQTALCLANALLTLQFDIEAATRDYRQMPYFPPLPHVPDIDFRPWTTYQSQAYELELYGNILNKPAQEWADWISKTEQYLLQEHPWAAQGRGSNLHTVTNPLMPHPKGQTWKKGKPAFWEQLKARFQLALQQPDTYLKGPVKGFTQMIKDVHRHST